jgi:NAD(P)-dependent dehydrogenase (short-subunit alcohol dehydrogenase family)
MSSSKIALVTGGNRGLGKEMARSLAAQGTDVIITYRSGAAEADAVVTELQGLGGRALAVQLDLNDLSSYEAFVSQLATRLRDDWQANGIDYLVQNAGIGATVTFANATEELFDEMLNIHFKGVYFLTQRLLPHLRNGGGIVTISSGTTRFVNPGYSIYASMKGAIEVFTRYLAKELGPRGIRANVVAPGPIETDFNNAAIRSNPELSARLGSMTALGRVGQADDIGGVVAFLCSDAARWVNGQRIEASGGINL